MNLTRSWLPSTPETHFHLLKMLLANCEIFIFAYSLLVTHTPMSPSIQIMPLHLKHEAGINITLMVLNLPLVSNEAMRGGKSQDMTSTRCGQQPQNRVSSGRSSAYGG